MSHNITLTFWERATSLSAIQKAYGDKKITAKNLNTSSLVFNVLRFTDEEREKFEYTAMPHPANENITIEKWGEAAGKAVFEFEFEFDNYSFLREVVGNYMIQSAGESERLLDLWDKFEIEYPGCKDRRKNKATPPPDKDAKKPQ